MFLSVTPLCLCVLSLKVTCVSESVCGCVNLCAGSLYVCLRLLCTCVFACQNCPVSLCPVSVHMCLRVIVSVSLCHTFVYELL